MSGIKESLLGRIITLLDGATVDVDPSALGPRGGIARLNSVNNPTLNAPLSNADGQEWVLEFTANTSGRQLALTTGASGFLIPTDIGSLTVTPASTTDRLKFVYRSSASRWWLTAYIKGF